MKTTLTLEQLKAGIARNESTRRYVKGLEEFKALAMATVLDAVYAAMSSPAKTREEILEAQKQKLPATIAGIPAVEHATEDDDDESEDDREFEPEPVGCTKCFGTGRMIFGPCPTCKQD